MATKGCLKRLSVEIPSLSTSLPLSFESGVYIRTDENRLDVLKVMIIGSEGTPYWNGCFVFDVFVPVTYPNTPPMVQLTTTGKNTVRFNPNLYHDGKVCLSLLGTWQGPSWDPKVSTLLQVFLSIQSLILVPDPYYNEPGFESHKNDKQSEMYNNTLRYHTIRVAMLDMLRHPVPEFEDVIRAHFKGKKQHLINQAQEWLDKCPKPPSGANIPPQPQPQLYPHGQGAHKNFQYSQYPFNPFLGGEMGFFGGNQMIHGNAAVTYQQYQHVVDEFTKELNRF